MSRLSTFLRIRRQAWSIYEFIKDEGEQRVNSRIKRWLHFYSRCCWGICNWVSRHACSSGSRKYQQNNSSNTDEWFFLPLSRYLYRLRWATPSLANRRRLHHSQIFLCRLGRFRKSQKNRNLRGYNERRYQYKPGASWTRKRYLCFVIGQKIGSIYLIQKL